MMQEGSRERCGRFRSLSKQDVGAGKRNLRVHGVECSSKTVSPSETVGLAGQSTPLVSTSTNALMALGLGYEPANPAPHECEA